MTFFNPDSRISPTVLATDLDGTLIPLPESKENLASLDELKTKLGHSQKTLVYATGRHYESVQDAISEYNLPTPSWIVCDVGSSIYQNVDGTFQNFQPYEDHLKKLAGGFNRNVVENLLREIEPLELQPDDHQQAFKISYQSKAELVEILVQQVNDLLEEKLLPFHCMGSLDPFLNCGLLDVMPQAVSKAYALIWLSQHADFTPDEVVYAGDSGNDLAALISGFRAIVVSNHSKGLRQKVLESLGSRGLADRAYFADGRASSGVLEGCRHFSLL
jgi:sucrose-6F-phosphate phosphohydrolase